VSSVDDGARAKYPRVIGFVHNRGSKREPVCSGGLALGDTRSSA
jgi:hypothetical protein